MNLLTWLQDSALGIWVAESIWGYPLVLSTHAIGMAIVVGTVIMIDLRILGFANDVPFKSFRRLFVVAWLGVALNVVSGFALFSGDPVHFFYHPVFWIKLTLILLGAVSVWLLIRATGPKSRLNSQPDITGSTKVTAVFSLLFWLSAIIAGRLIAYVEIS